MQPEKFCSRVQEYAGIGDRDRCKQLCGIVFNLLSMRLTEDESRNLWSQLPIGLKEMWNFKHDGKVLKIHREEFMQIVMNEGDLDSTEAAEDVIRGVFRALKEQITIGETGDVTAQLPGDMKDLWGSA